MPISSGANSTPAAYFRPPQKPPNDMYKANYVRDYARPPPREPAPPPREPRPYPGGGGGGCGGGGGGCGGGGGGCGNRGNSGYSGNPNDPESGTGCGGGSGSGGCGGCPGGAGGPGGAPGTLSDRCCCYCGGSGIYTTGIAGAGAGCCGGGMFGSRKYPFAGDQEYMLQNTGRHRCCACVWGLLIGLLLLALILGLVLGLDPYLQRQEQLDTLQAANPNGFVQNDIFYQPITDPPDVYYIVVGPGYPCNQYNNNSDIYAATTTATSVASGPSTTVISFITEPLLDVPDCDTYTTSIVLSDYTDEAPATQATVVTESSGADVIKGNMTSVMIGLATMLLLMTRMSPSRG